MSAATARLVGVTHIYPGPDGPHTAVRELNLTCPAGSRLAVLGPSGSGKSTLLTLLGGLQRATAGQVWVGDAELGALPQSELSRLRAGTVAMVVQKPTRNLLPYVSAEANIAFARRALPRRRRSALPSPAGLLDALGLQSLAGRPVARLSGGEQQRVALAVGLARRPGLLLLDEPTSQLDAASRDKVLALLLRMLGESDCTVVAVTHDPAVAQALGASVRMRDGALQ